MHTLARAAHTVQAAPCQASGPPRGVSCGGAFTTRGGGRYDGDGRSENPRGHQHERGAGTVRGPLSLPRRAPGARPCRSRRRRHVLTDATLVAGRRVVLRLGALPSEAPTSPLSPLAPGPSPPASWRWDHGRRRTRTFAFEIGDVSEGRRRAGGIHAAQLPTATVTTSGTARPHGDERRHARTADGARAKSWRRERVDGLWKVGRLPRHKVAAVPQLIG